MYLPETMVFDFRKNLVLKGKNRKEHNIHAMDHRDPDKSNHKTPRKDRDESYYTAKRASQSHNLLHCHHRADGKHVHIPVDDIL